jgi:diguanylate cyclase (GGDEF)-like protein/PAS domain S-box-containing protein
MKTQKFPVMPDSNLNVLANVIEQNSTAVMVTDENGLIQYINPQFTKETGYTINDLFNKTPVALTETPNDFNGLQAILNKLKTGETWGGELACKRKSGAAYWVEARFAAINDDDGRLKHCVTSFVDVSGRKMAQDQLSQMAHHDVLTDLPNHLALSKQFSQNLSLAKRQNKSLAFLFINIDNFKRLNDNYGLGYGDAVLKALAQRMSAVIRESDVIGRKGGDEFMMMLAEIHLEEDAIIVANKIQTCLAMPLQIEGKAECLTSSIGIALFPNHGASELELTSNAERAMRQVKSRGKNGIAVFKSTH